ncbi:Hha/YmoA family nucleoid-associated regulatory protein [Rahnella sikkimica]|uniref:Hha/YmoA family nucleoid-associated regulatory protein n=1 Tax=Rahnella sikkimica TaxID=1805933 RepID=UPI0026A490FD
MKMTKEEWLLKFRRCHTLDTLEKVYEHRKYNGEPADEVEMTQAYDHRKAEFAAGKLFDRVPAHVWQFVK